MSFLYPLGLLGLIGVPILIAIYIIKNKYTEQVISSTYLWTLSEKFLKKRLPINKLVGILSLILQIAAVVFISFSVAHPVFTIRNAANDYCFVLDGSGSMNIRQGSRTRFDMAKDEITDIINESVKGSSYSLVFVGENTEIVFEELTDKESALLLLDDVSVSCTATGYTDAIGVAQTYFNKNNSILNFLVTDKSFESSENVKVITVGNAQNNYALSDISYTLADGKLSVFGKAASYEDDAKLGIELYVDDGEEPAATQTLEVVRLEPTDFSFEYAVDGFKSLKVAITNVDALALDNSAVVYNVEYENSYSTLIVSDEPFFINAVLRSAGNARIKVISADEYKGDTGYDLYVFDTFNPEVLPSDGAVWFFNPTASVANSGFTVQDEIPLTVGVPLSYTKSTASLVKTLLKDVWQEDDIYLTKYQKCGLYRSFTTLLTCDGNPVVFTGTNTFGNREVVFAFDFGDSDMTVIMDYVTLARNLLNYSFPTIIDNASYYCGETLLINVTANCDSIRVDSPLGKISYLDTANDVCETELTEVGTYKITLMTGDNARVFNVYAALPESERFPTVVEASFGIAGEAGGGNRDGIFDNILFLFIALAVLFAADWVVYCYEQYQLR